MADQYLYAHVQKKSLKGYTKRVNIISSLQGYTKMVIISLEGRIKVISYFPFFCLSSITQNRGHQTMAGGPNLTRCLS